MPSISKHLDKALVTILGGSGLYIMKVVLKALPPKGNPPGALAKVQALPLFAWHPLCVSLASLILVPASNLVIRQRKSSQPKEKRSELGLLHAYFTGPAVTILSAGVYAIYKNKNDNKWAHLTSGHAYWGALALVAFLASAGTAIAHNLGYPGKIKAPKLPLEVTWNSRIHRLLGGGSLIASSLAVATGVTSKWGRGKKQFGDLAYPLAALVVLPSVLLALDVSKYLPSDDEPKDTQDKN